MTIFLLSAMPGQCDCGIALIEHDDMNNAKAKGLFALTGRKT